MDRHLLDELKFLMVFIPFVSILMGLMWQKDGSNIVLHLFTVLYNLNLELEVMSHFYDASNTLSPQNDHIGYYYFTVMHHSKLTNKVVAGTNLNTSH
jgi:hypothetical protein